MELLTVRSKEKGNLELEGGNGVEKREQRKNLIDFKNSSTLHLLNRRVNEGNSLWCYFNLFLIKGGSLCIYCTNAALMV